MLIFELTCMIEKGLFVEPKGKGSQLYLEKGLDS